MITVEGLSKSYGFRNETLALRNVSFSVNPAVRFGLLGAKGAGKTTLLRILAGSLRPTDGTVLIGGANVRERVQDVRKLVGYVPENLEFRDWKTGAAYLRFWGRASGLSRKDLKSRLAWIVEFLDLTEALEEELELTTVSVQRRLTLAQALLADPDVVLLDEPMAGLGIADTEFLVRKLDALQKEGKTIVLGTPRLEDIRAACEQVAVLSEGQLTKVYGTGDLLQKIGEGRDARIFVDCDAIPAQAVDALRQIEGVMDVKTTDTATIVYIVPGRVETASVREILASHDVEVRGVRMAHLKLGDVFSTLYT